MDLTKYRQKLIGSEDERAVSPVIGVILMVAITVILAAVIAAFVLDIGDDMGEGSVNAAVNTDVSQNDNSVTFTLEDAGSAEEFAVRGSEDGSAHLDGTDTEAPLDFDDGTVGATDTLSVSDNDIENSGELNIIAIDGNSESVVGSVEWDFD
ncbi:type IV pilin [Natronorubrum sp. DTA28]|uniref:type IV pilin n=1 Tax=Natronorubrum sp. DTA28 TaxID=3447019 RepID=UPI003F85F774